MIVRIKTEKQFLGYGYHENYWMATVEYETIKKTYLSRKFIKFDIN